MAIAPHPVFGGMPGAFLDALGTTVTVKIGAAAPKAVRAIVRAPAGQIAGEAGYSAPGATGRIVTASFAESDVAGLSEGDLVTIGGVGWLVKEPLPDGRGMMRCELERAP
jgi:hypothetical protein